jgi:hypothetical protein
VGEARAAALGDGGHRRPFGGRRRPLQFSCRCGTERREVAAEGDHYIAIITDGKGVIPNGTRIAVPNAKMKVDKGNPTRHGIIFLGVDGKVFCYVTPSGL